ncbi:MAG: ABC transporter substrate-binding protein [Lentisphaerae bacterium]|jgi:iron complex transport system substrate-binding protein|nr:ABC transporter substrate-binding protein [Lentisphaerota bacterium]MBT5609704.1 ABC transporter substrate-binding protein [Lentisphaerota bacterium]MBT7061440.1 ABC transporter substrate-binding protein [Lentisphaerota bacterium]MBT7844188.1 ABC transporter substrate-binding protein [Lentisphaerota bacterium]
MGHGRDRSGFALLNEILGLASCLLFLTLLVLTGCSPKKRPESTPTAEADERQEATEARANVETLVLEETTGSILVGGPAMPQPRWFTKRPKRVVILLGSFLELWYDCGGQAIARTKNVGQMPEGAGDLPVLGTISHINAELLVELQPDLVIAPEIGSLRKYRTIMESNGFPVLTLRYRHYADFVEIYSLFCLMNGREDLLAGRLGRIENDVAAIVERCPKDVSPTIVVVLCTPNSVSCELRGSSAGAMLERLGAKNLATDRVGNTQMRTELSFERIIADDPDVVFFTTMGDTDKGREIAKKTLMTNPAWKSLSASRNGRVHFLDKKLFTYKPNCRYPAAFRILAGLLYPGVFLEGGD